jgi:LemA protein
LYMGVESGTTVFVGVVGIFVLAAVGAVIFAGLSYNSLVARDVAVEEKWANVQAAYQRRADLLPNLVETVKGSRDFEAGTLTRITELRSEAGSARVSVQGAKDARGLQDSGAQMNSVLSRLLVIVENYPELKSTQAFSTLMGELAGTEDQVKLERDAYNSAVKDYKTEARSFPANMFAQMLGFSPGKWEMFEADAAAQNSPKVGFG